MLVPVEVRAEGRTEVDWVDSKAGKERQSKFGMAGLASVGCLSEKKEGREDGKDEVGGNSDSLVTGDISNSDPSRAGCFGCKYSLTINTLFIVALGPNEKQI